MSINSRAAPSMMRNLQLGAAFAAAWLIAASPAFAASPSAKILPSPVPSVAAPDGWPQARSDLKPDPEIRFGVLPNGMRYAIQRQTIPAGQAALRLVIGSGALQESDAQQGLAHFLEHMAFEGSKDVPQGEMIRI